jgi:hypothetical protein
MRHSLLTIALSLAVAGSAQAQVQQLKIAFNGGHVSLDATSVPVRTILAEWSKLGGTKVVGAEKIAGTPLTLKLDDVPESQALEIILRNVAGYMAAPRAANAGASMYDRILVMATSSAPPAAAARPTPTGPGPVAGTQRFVPPRAVVQSPDEDNEPEEEPERPERNQPVFTFPQPGQGGFPQQGGFGPQGVVMPPGNSNPNANAPAPVTVNPTAPPVPPYGSTGFGVVGSPMPGVIQQPPQPQPGQPVPPAPGVRPPGV